MEDLDIYKDYSSWLKENNKLITSLIEANSKAISRFTPVIKVVNFLYGQQKYRKLTEDEKLFFSTGFDYIFDQFHLINTLLESKFNNSLKEFEKFSVTINLLLYVNEFQNEILSQNDEKVKRYIKDFDNLDNKINEYIDKGENAPEEYFQVLNDLVDKAFEANGIELHTVDEIFYEISLEYGLDSEASDDTFNYAFNEQIEKNRGGK